ncbi:MAG TPA: hypothetical protein VMF31_10625 [Solirubrobacterales bacterium]|nr:hypothetical protein [Solirubrobacterales bacterium]
MTYIFLGGLAAIVAGIAMITIPGALIIGGAMAAAVAYLSEREKLMKRSAAMDGTQ